MPILRPLPLALLIILLAACAAPGTPAPSPTPISRSAEEEAVYAALFDELYGEPRLLVLASETSPGMVAIEDWQAPPALEALEPATVENFQQVNAGSHPLAGDMQVGLPYVLFTPAEQAQIFDLNTSAWDVFYTRYPNSPGISTISRVGFNPDFSQALVYLGTLSNWLAGAGYYVLLEKSGGTWQVLQQSLAWIS